MFIAFEGPDNVGKSTSAATLAHDGIALYNVTKDMHERQREEAALFDDKYMPVTYDRIDWFTHMVYRLALPDREWHDDRVRTVFAMPDTHLVVKLHHPELANFKADEVVDTPIARVNPMYYYFTDFFTNLNREREYSLFKTVSIMEVRNDPRDGSFSQRLVMFDSPAVGWGSAAEAVHNDDSLLEFLQYEESQRL